MPRPTRLRCLHSIMASDYSWICENGHTVPDRSFLTCPDCNAARGPAYRGLPSTSGSTPPRSAAASASDAQGTILGLLIGGVVVGVLAGLVLGASWPDSPRPGSGSTLGLFVGWLMVAAAQLMIFVGAVAAGVRLGIKASG